MEAYERAVRDGAQLVIGPLTRSAVTALAATQLVNVPTLALNTPEADSVLPQNLFLFGLQVENEAKQVAQLAREKGRRALVIASETTLSRRLAQSFADEFAHRGGTVVDQVLFVSDSPVLIKLRDSIAAGISDVIFLALDAQRARAVRSYLGGAQPIFATSLVYVSAEPLANFELNGVYFVDMPWLLSPDHPAVLAYTDSRKAASSSSASMHSASTPTAWCRICSSRRRAGRRWTASPARSLQHVNIASCASRFQHSSIKARRARWAIPSDDPRGEKRHAQYRRASGAASAWLPAVPRPQARTTQLRMPPGRDRPHPAGRQDAGVRRGPDAAQPRIRRGRREHHAAQARPSDCGRTATISQAGARCRHAGSMPC
jgi:hypothetical protein